MGAAGLWYACGCVTGDIPVLLGSSFPSCTPQGGKTSCHQHFPYPDVRGSSVGPVSRPHPREGSSGIQGGTAQPRTGTIGLANPQDAELWVLVFGPHGAKIEEFIRAGGAAPRRRGGGTGP